MEINMVYMESPLKLILDSLTLSSNHATREEAQAISRIVISAVFTILAAVFYYLTDDVQTPYQAITAATIYFSLSLTYYWLIRKYPEHFPARKFLTLFSDTAIITWCCYVMGISGLILYPLFLWVAIAYRARYGTAYLLGGIIITSMGFFIATLNNDVWVHFKELTLSLVSGLIVFPLLFHNMLHKSEKAMKEVSNKADENRFLASHDSLTGLLNRSFVEEMLELSIASANRAPSNISVIFLDIDEFSTINDTLGTKVGDELLELVAKRIELCVWDIDIVGRIGSDDFLIIINTGRNSDITPVLNRLVNSVGGMYKLEDHEVELTLSMGVARYPHDGLSTQELIMNADTAMRSAKKNAGNCYSFYDRAMTEWLKEDLSYRRSLATAIIENQFELYYQPQVSLVTGEIIGAEALIRWKHPEKGFIPPDRFIPLAEKHGFITEISNWVLNTAVHQLKQWHDMGYPPITIAVNLSAHNLQDPGFVNGVKELTSHVRLDNRFLELEVTESMLMDNTEHYVEVLTALRECGFRLAMDDFGTGYSSLAYLQRFPFDKLKIDREFIRGIASSTQSAALVRSILAMGRNLQMRVVAEGVESDLEAHFLRQNMCDHIQGYLISKPVNSIEFERLLQIQGAIWSGHLANKSENVVLAVDDDPIALTALKGVLKNQGYTIITADNTETAFELLAHNPVSVVISDHKMPDMTGVEFLSRIRKIYPDTVRILLTVDENIDIVREAINRGAIYKFLTKTTSPQELLAAVDEALKAYSTVTH